jgi:hypothetical protein
MLQFRDSCGESPLGVPGVQPRSVEGGGEAGGAGVDAKVPITVQDLGLRSGCTPRISIGPAGYHINRD